MQTPSSHADRAALLLTLLCGAAAAWLFYLVRWPRLLPAPSPGDGVVFASYCLALLLSLVLLLFAALSALGARRSRLLAGLVLGVLGTAIYIDDRLYQLMGLHIYSHAVTRLVGRRDVNNVLHMTWGEGALLLGGIAALCGLTLLLSRGFGRLLRRVSDVNLKRGLLAGLAALLLVCTGSWLLAAAGLAPTTPLARILPMHEVFFGSQPAAAPVSIHYPLRSGAIPKMQRKPNILLVLVETLRADMLTPTTMPELSQFATRATCRTSEHHHSSSHVTDFSFFSVVYGLHAYHYLFFGQQAVPSFPLQVFKANGYAVLGAASSPVRDWGDMKVLLKQFDAFQEFSEPGPAERDQAMVRWATRWRAEHDPAQPYVLLLFFDATHHKYFYPPGHERFTPALPDDHNLIKGDVDDPAIRSAFFNRYKNSVGYVDHLLGDLLRDFATDKNLLVALTGDHGEEFWDNGLLGHTAVNFVNARTQVPLVLCTPDSAPPPLVLSSHADIMPTLLDYTRLEPPLPEAQYSNGTSLLRPQGPQRQILISAMGFPVHSRQVCLVSQSRKYWLRKESTGNKAFVLTRTTDLYDVQAPPLAEELARGLVDLNAKYRTFLGH